MALLLEVWGTLTVRMIVLIFWITTIVPQGI
jgi:hypothetical protein